MGQSSLNLMRGTLDLLVMKILTQDVLHGYEISRRIEQKMQEEIQIEEGALYPALRRMEERGWLESEWGLSDTNREVKYYRLTRAGKEELAGQQANWRRYVKAMDRVLRLAEATS
jgi:transcriptional regulator